MHNVLWTRKQTKHCRYIKTQAWKAPSAAANVFLLTSHVQPRSRLLPRKIHHCISSPLHLLGLSAFLSSHTHMLWTADTPLHSRTNFRPFAGSQEAPAPRGPGKPWNILSTLGSWARETPGIHKIHQDDPCMHADFYLMHVKQIAVFRKEIFYPHTQLI